MISFDTNIVFSALESSARGHREARLWMDSISENRDVAICELVLLELYTLLRNPIVCAHPLAGQEAAQVIQAFRSHPYWPVLDYPGPQAKIMNEIWTRSAVSSFAYKRIYDARLALTLRHYGITEFATINVKDFQGYGFKKVWNPCA